VGASRALTAEQRQRVAAVLGDRVTAVAQDARSQSRNRELALERLREKLRSALTPPRERRPTRPTRAATEVRLEDKRRRSERKRLRRPPDDNE